jgi:hypothetical protein
MFMLMLLLIFVSRLTRIIIRERECRTNKSVIRIETQEIGVYFSVCILMFINASGFRFCLNKCLLFIKNIKHTQELYKVYKACKAGANYLLSNILN